MDTLKSDGLTLHVTSRRTAWDLTHAVTVPRGIDHWDPEFLDALAAGGRVIVFDNVGVGGSTGESISEMADSGAAVAQALGLGSVDVGGGMVAQTRPWKARDATLGALRRATGGRARRALPVLRGCWLCHGGVPAR